MTEEYMVYLTDFLEQKSGKEGPLDEVSHDNGTCEKIRKGIRYPDTITGG
jgi:hypothetical protein